MPLALSGKKIDAWMKIRILVNKLAETTLGLLEPARHRELTQASLSALRQWTFDSQLTEDEALDGELTVRLHFRTH